jgi:murein DD-endopeptidase
MIVNWKAVFKNERKQFEGMSEAEKFVYFLLLQYKSPYLWGEENPEGSDCSGAVCMSLYAATGLLIRTTADDLFKRVFTVLNAIPQSIRAAFFVDKKGIASHVAGLVDDGVILNSQEPGARVRTLADISTWFGTRGHSTIVRGLNRAVLEKMAADKNNVNGLDKLFSHYFLLEGTT